MFGGLSAVLRFFSACAWSEWMGEMGGIGWGDNMELRNKSNYSEILTEIFELF